VGLHKKHYGFRFLCTAVVTLLINTEVHSQNVLPCYKESWNTLFFPSQNKISETRS